MLGVHRICRAAGETMDENLIPPHVVATTFAVASVFWIETPHIHEVTYMSMRLGYWSTL
jgi:hypothetical protein